MPVLDHRKFVRGFLLCPIISHKKTFSNGTVLQITINQKRREKRD